MFTTPDDRQPESSAPAPIDGAVQVWDPTLWAAYLLELSQEQHRRSVN